MKTTYITTEEISAFTNWALSPTRYFLHKFSKIIHLAGKLQIQGK